MTLPVRSWLTAATASILSKSASPWPGAVLGERHLGQHQILQLLRVGPLVARAEGHVLGLSGRSAHSQRGVLDREAHRPQVGQGSIAIPSRPTRLETGS
jgi:hypothetical protein